jgi:hypothetical protein
MLDLTQDLSHLISNYDAIFNGGTDTEVATAEHNFVATFDQVQKNHNLEGKKMVEALTNHFATNGFSDSNEDWNSVVHFTKKEAIVEVKRLITDYKKLAV